MTAAEVWCDLIPAHNPASVVLGDIREFQHRGLQIFATAGAAVERHTKCSISLNTIMRVLWALCILIGFVAASEGFG